MLAYILPAGFAFCDYQTRDMADDCVRDMDGMMMENLAIKVEIARRYERTEGNWTFVWTSQNIYHPFLRRW